jgi:hypothetical protein
MCLEVNKLQLVSCKALALVEIPPMAKSVQLVIHQAGNRYAGGY